MFVRWELLLSFSIENKTGCGQVDEHLCECRALITVGYQFVVG